MHEQAPPHYHRQGLKGSSHITVSCASRGSNALRSSREGACRRRRGPAEPATCANAAAAQQARHGARRRAPARMNLGAFGLFKHRPPAPRFWLPAFFLHWLFVLDVSVAQQLHTTKTNNQLSRKERQTYKRHCNDFDVCLPFYQMKSNSLPLQNENSSFGGGVGFVVFNMGSRHVAREIYLGKSCALSS